MIIELKKPAKIGRKLHPVGTRITVVWELGKELVKSGKAWCVDGTFNIEKVKYVQEPAKKVSPKK